MERVKLVMVNCVVRNWPKVKEADLTI